MMADIYIMTVTKAINGVKQGAVLSPISFDVYIDGLLVQMTKKLLWALYGNPLYKCSNICR